MRLATASKALKAAKARSSAALGVALALTLLNRYFLTPPSSRDGRRSVDDGIRPSYFGDGVDEYRVGGPPGARSPYRSRMAVLSRVVNLVAFACAVVHGIALGDRVVTPLTLWRGAGGVGGGSGGVPSL